MTKTPGITPREVSIPSTPRGASVGASVPAILPPTHTVIAKPIVGATQIRKTTFLYGNLLYEAMYSFEDGKFSEETYKEFSEKLFLNILKKRSTEEARSPVEALIVQKATTPDSYKALVINSAGKDPTEIELKKDDLPKGPQYKNNETHILDKGLVFTSDQYSELSKTHQWLSRYIPQPKPTPSLPVVEEAPAPSPSEDSGDQEILFEPDTDSSSAEKPIYPKCPASDLEIQRINAKKATQLPTPKTGGKKFISDMKADAIVELNATGESTELTEQIYNMILADSECETMGQNDRWLNQKYKQCARYVQFREKWTSFLKTLRCSFSCFHPKTSLTKEVTTPSTPPNKPNTEEEHASAPEHSIDPLYSIDGTKPSILREKANAEVEKHIFPASHSDTNRLETIEEELRIEDDDIAQPINAKTEEEIQECKKNLINYFRAFHEEAKTKPELDAAQLKKANDRIIEFVILLFSANKGKTRVEELAIIEILKELDIGLEDENLSFYINKKNKSIKNINNSKSLMVAYRGYFSTAISLKNKSHFVHLADAFEEAIQNGILYKLKEVIEITLVLTSTYPYRILFKHNKEAYAYFVQKMFRSIDKTNSINSVSFTDYKKIITTTRECISETNLKDKNKLFKSIKDVLELHVFTEAQEIPGEIRTEVDIRDIDHVKAAEKIKLVVEKHETLERLEKENKMEELESEKVFYDRLIADTDNQEQNKFGVKTDLETRRKYYRPSLSYSQKFKALFSKKSPLLPASPEVVGAGKAASLDEGPEHNKMKKNLEIAIQAVEHRITVAHTDKKADVAFGALNRIFSLNNNKDADLIIDAAVNEDYKNISDEEKIKLIGYIEKLIEIIRPKFGSIAQEKERRAEQKIFEDSTDNLFNIDLSNTK